MFHLHIVGRVHIWRYTAILEIILFNNVQYATGGPSCHHCRTNELLYSNLFIKTEESATYMRQSFAIKRGSFPGQSWYKYRPSRLICIS